MGHCVVGREIQRGALLVCEEVYLAPEVLLRVLAAISQLLVCSLPALGVLLQVWWQAQPLPVPMDQGLDPRLLLTFLAKVGGKPRYLIAHCLSRVVVLLSAADKLLTLW